MAGNKKGRPSLDARIAAPSPRIAVRLPWDTYRAVSSRATSEGKTVSGVVRELLADYAHASPSVTAAEHAEIRRLAKLPDREREAYFLTSLRNIERLRHA